MIKVKNKKIKSFLSRKTLFANKNRNIIAISAIILTTLLFTSLFTIAISINDGFQQNNFRQAGGFAHGTFKYLTKEQYGQLKDDTLIKEYGVRRFLGMPTDEPFNKSHVEVGYSDANYAHWTYCDPIEGTLPKENTNEAATDTKVLELLGVKPELGTEFTVTFYVDKKKTTQTFTLCGFWEYDSAVVANNILIPESRVNSILNELDVQPSEQSGSWNLNVMFKNSFNIESKINKILENHGYQNEQKDDNYIAIGVNWGYSASQLYQNMDTTTILAILSALIIIIFTGYLIIYNVFQISVSNDIKFYGLLKTIGTTPKQLKIIIRKQAIMLSCVGVPIGLLLGWFVGGKLTPVISNQLDGIVTVISINPIIFIVSALFSIFTVLISCHKPEKIAAKVSAIEAVRYTDAANTKQKGKRKSQKASILSMAKANVGRNKIKTVVTVLSLSLSVVLLTITIIFTKGFDMDKYLRRMAVDFQIANAGYFQTGGEIFNKDMELSENVIEQMKIFDGIKGGITYGKVSAAQEFVTEEYYRNSLLSHYNTEEQMDSIISFMEKDKNNMLVANVQLYGMEDFILDKLTVHEGDISKIKEPNSKYIAAVYSDDDYGEIIKESQWAKLGDTVKIRYVDKFEYFNPNTGEVYSQDEDFSDLPFSSRAVEYHEEEYIVAAIVTIPSSLSYRYYGSDEFILNSQTFINDTGTDSVMYYAFDVDENKQQIKDFLESYTTEINSSLDYESKDTYAAQFSGFRNMFLILGISISAVVAIIGILNFFNAILTGICVRQREFAVLQSIGMTGKQLKKMLVFEGLWYALTCAIFSLILALVLSPIIGNMFENIFWFFTYKFSIIPVLLLSIIFAFLGIILPLITYKFTVKHSIVERLRAE